MRKLMIGGLAFVVSLGVMAQGGSSAISNASFEQYSTVSIPVPANWENSSESFKILYLGQYSYGIKQEQPGFSGNYALRIEVPNVPSDTFIMAQYFTLPSTYVPALLELWSFSLRYKYYPNNANDTARIILAGLDDTLGLSAFGKIDVAGTANAYTLASSQVFVGLSFYDPTKFAQNVKYWLLLVFSNPGCTLVIDSINMYDNSNNHYSLFPVNPDFEDWYTVSVDTFKKWKVSAPFEHETIYVGPTNKRRKLISKISSTLRADSNNANNGKFYAELSTATRAFFSDTPYNSLYQIIEVGNNNLFDFTFAYKYTSPFNSDSALFLILLSEKNSSNIAFYRTYALPQTADWDTVHVPLTSLCSGCQVDTVLLAFIPQRAIFDTTGGNLSLQGAIPVDTAAKLLVDSAKGIVIAANTPEKENAKVILISQGNKFELIANSDIKHVKIIDILGKTIKTEKPKAALRRYTLDLQNVDKGVYMIEVTTFDGTDLIKVNVR